MTVARWIAIVAVAVVPAVIADAQGAPAPLGAKYSFTCDGSSPVSLTPVSFDVGMSMGTTVGNQGSGAGAGKPSLMPFTVKFLMNKDVKQLMEIAQLGHQFAHCALTETSGSAAKGEGQGATYEFDFGTLQVESVQFIGSDASNSDSGGSNVPTAFAQVAFSYGSLRILQ